MKNTLKNNHNHTPKHAKICCDMQTFDAIISESMEETLISSSNPSKLITLTLISLFFSSYKNLVQLIRPTYFYSSLS